MMGAEPEDIAVGGHEIERLFEDHKESIGLCAPNLDIQLVEHGEDFNACHVPLITENGPIAPVQSLRVTMSSHNHPTHNSGRRKIKTIGHFDTHLAGIPGWWPGWGLMRQKLGDQAMGCVSLRKHWFDLVTEIKAFHETQEDGIETRILWDPILIFCPDTREVRVHENAIGFVGHLVFENPANCFGNPVWFENNNIFEDRIIHKIQNPAQVM
jgi:hypothetical protein